MAARLVVSPQADRDADAIWLFIATRDLRAATALIDRLTKTARTLSSTPLAGRARPELGVKLRSFPVESYVLFYIPLPDGIEIIRILHGRQDIKPEDFA